MTQPSLRSSFRAIPAIALWLAVAGCSDVDTGTETTPPIVVTVTPTTATLEVGESKRAVATVTGGMIGAPLSPTWKSSDVTIATVSPNGDVTGIRVGTAVVTAVIGSVSAPLQVIVVAPAAASIDVIPRDTTIRLGRTGQLRATVRDRRGNVLDRLVTWQSSDPAVASISNTAKVTGVAVGMTTITASAELASATTNVLVSLSPVVSAQVGGPEQIAVRDSGSMTVSAVDEDGVAVTGRPVIWTSSNLSIASVTDGLVVGKSPGAATISARIEGFSTTRTLTVIPEVPVRLTLTPATQSLEVFKTAKLDASVFDRQGNRIDRTVTWSTANAAVATVTSNGSVTAIAPGTTTITATVQNLTQSATITVTPSSSPGTVSISFTSPIAVGSFSTATARGFDGGGNILPIASVVWSSSDPSIAFVDNSVPLPHLIGVSAGSAMISATTNGITGARPVTITPGPTAFVEITPNVGPNYVDDSLQFTVRTVNASGAVITGRPIVWSTSTPSLVSVSSTGLAVGLGEGSATVTASADGIPKSLTFSIVKPYPVRVTFTPAQVPPIHFGETFQLVVTGYDRHGKVTQRVPQWYSANDAIAVVSETGVVQPVKVGTTTVFVAIGAVFGISITIAP